MTSGGAAVLLLQQAEAQPILDVFRGKDPGTLSGARVSVNVLNGSGWPARPVTPGRRSTCGRLRRSVRPATPPRRPTTVIKYAPGSEQAADLLARHLTTAATAGADPTLEANHLTLVTGTDFTTVMQTPSPAAPQPPRTPTCGRRPMVDPRRPPDPTSTTVVGITPGQPPPGVSC